MNNMNENKITTLIPSTNTKLQWDPKRINYLLQNKNINKSGYSPNKNINYFDLGTYTQAIELKWVVNNVLSKLENPYRVFAFEANHTSFNLAKNETDQINNLELYNVALVNKVPESKFIKLYCNNRPGDSIYRKTKSYINVQAKKLSDIIREQDVKLEESINIIRMNIEGSEYDVIEDLIESDLIKHFDGFYGTWNDVFKLDNVKYKKLQRMLKDVDVYPFPFNGIDMNKKPRTRLIYKSLMNSITGTNLENKNDKSQR